MSIAQFSWFKTISHCIAGYKAYIYCISRWSLHVYFHSLEGIPKLICCLSGYKCIDLSLYASFQNPMSSIFMFHRTRRPLFFSFIGLNVLTFMFHRTQHPFSLCFHRTHRLHLYIFIGHNVLVFLFS